MVTFVTVLGILIVWAYGLHSNATQKVQVAPHSPILAQCVQPELAGIQELLSKTTNQNTISLLTDKKKALEQAEQDCIARAKLQSPAQKPQDPSGVFLPLPTSNPISPKTGIQLQELLPVGNFVPTSDMPNFWAGMYKGNLIEIAAGFLREEDENWQQNHPEWAGKSQGALYVVINGQGINGKVHPTPSRNGSVHLVSDCEGILNLEAADGTLFSFDVETLTYLENAIPCSVP